MCNPNADAADKSGIATSGFNRIPSITQQPILPKQNAEKTYAIIFILLVNEKMNAKIASTVFLSTEQFVNSAWLNLTMMKSIKLNCRQNTTKTKLTVTNGINRLSIGWS